MRATLLTLLLAGYAAAQGAGPPAPAPTTSTPAVAAPPAPPASSSPQRPASSAAPAPPSNPQTTPQSQASTPAAQPPSSASPTSFTGTPTLVWQSLPTATQCETAQVRWSLNNIDRTKYAVNLYAYNIGVDQAIPAAPAPAPAPAPSSSAAAAPANTPAAQPSNNNNNANANSNNNANSSPAGNAAPAASAAAPASAAQPNAQTSRPPTTQAVAGGNAAASPAKRSPNAYGPLAHRNPMLANDEYMHLVARADVNSTVVKGWRANIPYNWVVDVPPGRYRILAIVNDEARTWSESQPFTVVASKNTTCVKKDTSDASKTSSSAEAGQTSGNAAAGSGSEESESKKSGLSGGAIAGVVIGVLAGLALAILAFICFRKAARDKRRDAGGREPQTPMRNLIGAPTDFRKTKGARASMGHALAAIGIGANRNGDRMERAERGEKPTFSAVPRMNLGNRRGSDMTNETDNPFETAPTTPVEEKSPSHTPGSSFGTSIPPASALAAGAAARDSHGYPPQSPPRGAYDGIEEEPNTFRRSTPTPMRLPPSQLPANLAPSSVGTTPPGGTPGGTGPTTPVTPGFAQRASHHSRPSAGSLHDAVNTPAAANSPAVLPPSAFPVTPTSPGKVVERKTSTRRKPVPRLEDDTALASPSQGHSSDSGHERNRTVSGLKLPETGAVGGGPAGDEYGFNAALAGVDPSQTYTLMPDPPLQQDDRR